MKIICAFSSDYRELYKADIYRAMSLPEGAILHFRYRKKYVDSNLIAANPELIGRRVAIFFVHGNKDDGSTNVARTSVRYATISKHEISFDTDVFHVYLKLAEFCNLTIDSGNSAEKLPSNRFFSELECTPEAGGNSWMERVGEVSQLLPSLLYFQIKGISDEGNAECRLKYTEDGRSCHYTLTGGKRYVLKLAVANPRGGTESVLLEESSKSISINSINPLESSALVDDAFIPLIVHNLQVLSQPALLSFKPTMDLKDRSDYSTNIELKLHTGWVRPILFGLFSLVALGAAMAVQPVNPSYVTASLTKMLICGLAFWAASGALYFWFNKK